ncbi:alpha/beta fold hydrolase [Neotamlana sedimentorum]|uniref:alpha/beta fold hydrolase n=1 Tax=Neotamlana sedimentorum TaxID=1435349 RepID=UPI00069CAA8C|nr:alpha/beta hydrolase [Tamlana sedimentorum]
MTYNFQTTYITIILILGMLNFSNAQSLYGNNNEVGNFISVNGDKQYYEIYGEGQPLVLIHGNGGDIAYMKPQIEYFSKKYKVIVMDCRGRGKSELGDESLTYKQIAKDIVAILDHENLDSTYVLGRSDGAILALLLAIHYPEKVKKIVAFSANLTPDTTALYPVVYKQIKERRKHADEMLAKKDTTQNWKVTQQRVRMMEFQPNITIEDLHKIKCPVLVMSTDRDMIREEHTFKIYQNIEKANLCFLPGVNHFVSKNGPELFNQIIETFFYKPFKGDEIRL